MSTQPPDPATAGQLEVETWLEQLGTMLPPGTLELVGPDERAAILDLARVAAHRSQRWAAPVSTFLAGIAYASLPRPERLERMRALVAMLDGDMD